MDNLSITVTESRYFNDLFVCCDVEKTGKIPFLKATEMFRSANLSNDVIRQITLLSGIQQTALHINRSQFYSCLKLIAAHQASLPLRAELLSQSIRLPLPRFSWKESPPMSRSSSSGSASISSVNVTCAATTTSSGVVNSEPNGFISSVSGTAVSGNPVDPNRSEWREGTASHSDLIDLARPRDVQQETANSDLQSTDSEVEHNESSSGRGNRRHRTGSPEAWSTNSDSPTPTNSVAERPWKKDSIWQGLLGDEHRQLLGTEEESSDRHSSDDDNEADLESVYQITSEQREYYMKQFRAVQPDPNGLLSGHIARVFFEKSRIPVEELRHIWQLCDVTRDGALSLAEFTAAMHLVVLRRNNIPLPSVLPPCLNPTVLNQLLQPVEPPEADLLHLGDDDKPVASTTTTPLKVNKENDYKRMISVHADKNIINLGAIPTPAQASTQKSTSPKAQPALIHKPNSSESNSPQAEISSSPPKLATVRVKDVTKDWANQSKEWTKFTESPTSNVSSPGLKPVNFDMQRTAQAVVSDPQILHPVPLRVVTPVAGTEIPQDDESLRIHRKSDGMTYEQGVMMRESDSSPKQQHHSSTPFSIQPQHLDLLQGATDLRAIQRPQPKKLPAKSIGAIPPPPQRESSIGTGSADGSSVVTVISDGNSVSVGASGSTNLINNKKEPPPIPPPRPPHRHARSSSLDLNKLKMGGTPSQPEIITQTSFDIDVSDAAGFADFAHFPETTEPVSISIGDQHSFGVILRHSEASQPLSLASTVDDGVPPAPRPTIPSQRVSAFEVYRKPNSISRNSQSPSDANYQLALQQGQYQYQQGAGPSGGGIVGLSLSSGAEYEKRAAAISDSLRQISFKQEKNVVDVLRHLKEQNVLLLRLCHDLSEELLSVQHRKEEIRSKLDTTVLVTSASTSSAATASNTALNIRAITASTNLSNTNNSSSSSSSILHSNV